VAGDKEAHRRVEIALKTQASLTVRPSFLRELSTVRPSFVLQRTNPWSFGK